MVAGGVLGGGVVAAATHPWDAGTISASSGSSGGTGSGIILDAGGLASAGPFRLT